MDATPHQLYYGAVSTAVLRVAQRAAGPSGGLTLRDIRAAALLMLALCQLVWQLLRVLGARAALLLCAHVARRLRGKAAAAAALRGARAAVLGRCIAAVRPPLLLAARPSPDRPGGAAPVVDAVSADDAACLHSTPLVVDDNSPPSSPIRRSTSALAGSPARSRRSCGDADPPAAAAPAGAALWQRRISCPGAGCAAAAECPAPAASGPLLVPRPPDSGLAGRLTVVLDLDETLVAPPRRGHAAAAGPSAPRPGVPEFLSRLSAAAELVLWTAAGPAYARRQLRELDPEGRLFSACVCGELTPAPAAAGRGAAGAGAGAPASGGAKDLSRLSRDLARVVLVDNSPSSMALQPQNGVPCAPFRGQARDQVLLSVILPLLLSLAEYDGDVRPILDRKIQLARWLEGRAAKQQPQ